MTRPYDSDLFFEEAQEALDMGHLGRGGVVRDRWGRAMLKAPDSDEKSPYTAASSLANQITNTEFVHKWEMRMLAKGLGLRPDLGRLAAIEKYSTALHPPAFEKGEKAASGRALDNLIERALDAVAIHEKADYGTAFHGHTEPGAPQPTEHDPEMKTDVDSFWDFCRRECITLVDTERFTVNESTGSAGTFDHGIRVLGHPLLTGYVVADKKTGRVDPDHWAIQIASYAHGMFYDRETDERTSMPQDVNLKWGAVLHTPALTGQTKLYPVNLELGWTLALYAASARDLKAKETFLGAYESASFEDRLAACTTKEELTMLWHSHDTKVGRALITEKAGTL